MRNTKGADRGKKNTAYAKLHMMRNNHTYRATFVKIGFIQCVSEFRQARQNSRSRSSATQEDRAKHHAVVHQQRRYYDDFHKEKRNRNETRREPNALSQMTSDPTTASAGTT